VPVPDPADPRPAWEQIAADLRERIRAGRVASGTWLPSQDELARQYGGVSRGTVRQAITELKREGLLATSTKGMLVMAVPVGPKLPGMAEVVRRLEAVEEDVRRLKAERDRP
jgi:DNA-binding FadR family transcriptional regulator